MNVSVSIYGHILCQLYGHRCYVCKTHVYITGNLSPKITILLYTVNIGVLTISNSSLSATFEHPYPASNILDSGQRLSTFIYK